ncbi:MAG: hypothetical protein K1X72_04175 [Pyrinomonadaceae bacterium]|nr:hypothetical protein [Pyrinomonadaceae bacterium]
MSVLTTTAFEQLLSHLDPDLTQASEKYETLRRKLVKSLLWKQCPETEADTLADTALDRVALKLNQGEEVRNVQAFAGEVLRFVWLEYLRRHKEDAAGDLLPETPVQPNIEILKDPDLRLRCLRQCLTEVVPENKDRMLIIGYYDTETGEKNKEHRKNLADKLNLTMITLKVKACRIRDRLEKCINECVNRLGTVTKSGI